MLRNRILVGAIVITTFLSVTTLAVRAGGKSNDERVLLDESKARATAEARLASLDALRPELAAAQARVDELRSSLSGKEAEIAKLDQKDTVAVTGQGRVFGAPDVLNLAMGVSMQRPTVREAMNAANDIAGRVIAALKANGVKPKDIQTKGIFVYPSYNYSNGQSTVNGYVAGNSVEAKIREVAEAGRVIASAAEAGGNDARVSGVWFNLEENTAMLKTARGAAMAAAKTKAEDYARLAGRKLGRIIYVSETTSSPPPPISQTSAKSAASSDAMSSVPIEPGERAAGVTVVVVFALE